MKYPISACRKLRKVVVKSDDLLALAVLGILPQQYLCTIKQSARRGGRLKGKSFPKAIIEYIVNIKSAVNHIYCRLYIKRCLDSAYKSRSRISINGNRYGNQRAAVAGYIKATCYIVYRNKWLTKRTKQIMQSYAYGFAVRFSVQVV